MFGLIEVKLHDIGEGMTEGEVLHYFVKQGDQVKPDQPLVEVQTDKMTAEIPAPSAGVVSKILIEPGTTVTVGTTLVLIENAVESTAQSKKEKPSTFHMVQMPDLLSNSRNKRQSPSKQVVLAAPYTRKIARENNVNIEEIKGTGPAGRITDEDVYAFIQKQQEPLAKASSETPQIMTINTNQPQKQIETIHHEPQKLANYDAEVIPFTGRRKQIAKKMTQSKFTIPHVAHFEEIDMTELMTFRKDLKESGYSISLVAFFIKALQLALRDFPIFNAKLDEENEVIKLEKNYNIGIATDTEDGLIVPVIRHVEQKSLKDIHKEMKKLTKKSQDGKLKAADITGGTFTISNVGPFGSLAATPIINHPEVGLMAFHKTKEMPVVRNGEIVIRWMMNISFVFDHRIADGLTAVHFTNRVKELLENPKALMLELI